MRSPCLDQQRVRYAPMKWAPSANASERWRGRHRLGVDTASADRRHRSGPDHTMGDEYGRHIYLEASAGAINRRPC